MKISRLIPQGPVGLSQPDAQNSTFSNCWNRFLQLLARPTNGASLGLFRICVGLVMALEAYSLTRSNPGAITAGGSPLETYYTGRDITFNFPYPGFEWLPLFSKNIIYSIVALQAVGGVLLALGLFYRLAAVLVFLSWGYLWIVESTRTYWQSHYYLEFLVSFLMIWMPAAQRFSLDAWKRKEQDKTIPFWPVLLLRAQLVIAYFYAGVAKLTKDWILDAVPVRWFLRESHVAAHYERLFSPSNFAKFKAFLESEGLAYFLSYSGLIFDLSVGFLLLFRRTRLFAMGCMVIFHATNHFLIFDDIGWFPLLGLTTALIFLEPDWPERFGRWVKRTTANAEEHAQNFRPKPLATWTGPLILIYLTVQAVVPLRHYFIAGDGRFTYEGMSFSWRLKSELRHAYVHQLFIRDSAIVSTDSTGKTEINWNNWHGDKVLYRRFDPARIDWRDMPEIFVVGEPLAGQRVFFNPLRARIANENEARARVKQIWQQIYGRDPQTIVRAASLSQLLDSISRGLRSGGATAEATALSQLSLQVGQGEAGVLPPGQTLLVRTRAVKALKEITNRDPAGTTGRYLRRLFPFVLDGAQNLNGPFLLIDDPPLLRDGLIDPKLWKNSAQTAPASVTEVNVGGDPLIVNLGAPGPEDRMRLPLEYICESRRDPSYGPSICWNSARDLSASKLLHVSNQAFYLRRYVRRVAALWQKDHHHWPTINAYTSMALNGRPHQPLVRPDADLARVSASWLRHNDWILDLQTPRIPREALRKRWEGAE